jgi:hypothetical protein
MDKRITFEDWEGFMAVRESQGLWALYFDREDDGLKGKILPELRVLEIVLTRRERKQTKPEPNSEATGVMALITTFHSLSLTYMLKLVHLRRPTSLPKENFQRRI